MNNVRMRRDFPNVTVSTIYDCICVIWRELAKTHTHNAGLQVHVYSPGHVLPRAGFAEERVVRFVAIVYHVWLVTDQVTIWVNSVLQTVKFPACIAHLYPSLAHVNRYAFPLEKKPKFIRDIKQALIPYDKRKSNAFGILHVEVPYLKNYYEFIIEFGVTKLNSTVPHSVLSSLIFFSNPAWTSDRNCAIEFFRTRYKTNTDKKNTPIVLIKR